MGIFHSKKNSGCSTGCVVVKWLIAALLFLVTVAALIGVFETHFSNLSGGIEVQFGSTGGSLAILAFAVSVTVWIDHILKIGKKCEVCNGK